MAQLPVWPLPLIDQPVDASALLTVGMEARGRHPAHSGTASQAGRAANNRRAAFRTTSVDLDMTLHWADMLSHPGNLSGMLVMNPAKPSLAGIELIRGVVPRE